LVAAAQTRTSIDELSQQLGELGSDARLAIGHVIDTLQDANRSRFAEGEDWTQDVYEFEDEVAEAFNIALDSTARHTERVAAVGQAGQLLSDLRAVVNNRVDERLDHYAEMSRVGSIAV
jgi:hypothetical protein